MAERLIGQGGVAGQIGRVLRRHTWIAPAIVLLLAFAVRFHALEAQSLWNDEGNSLRLAQRSVPDLLDAAGRDIHPPGYYLALKGWIALAGQSEFGLRSLSALQGVLAVALTIALGRTLFGGIGGALAGLFVALSPFSVYYSQETRMYAQLALFSAASMALFARWLESFTTADTEGTEKNRGENLRTSSPFFSAFSVLSVMKFSALALVNAAGLYTQYSFPFTLLAQGILFIAWIAWRRRAGRPLRRAVTGFVLLTVLTLALFAPWLPTAWQQVTTWPRTGEDLALGEQLRTVLTWLVYGNTAGKVALPQLLWPGALLIAALWPGRGRANGWRIALPLIWAVVVTGALFVSGAYRLANLKFLLPTQMALALLLAQGARRLWVCHWRVPLLSARQSGAIVRLLSVMCAVQIVLGHAQALDTLYNDPAYARADYRAIAARLTADERPGDAIILNAPNQIEVFSYYYRGSAPVYPLPRGLGGDDAATQAEVETILRQSRRVFAIFWGEEERDPRRIVQATLDSWAYPVASTWYGDVRLAQYAVLGPPPDVPAVTLDARFGDALRLTGYALSAPAARPGDAVGVTLFWTADMPLAARYKVTVQLLAPDGTLAAQHDAEPANNLAPTTAWTPGQTVIDTHGLVVPPDALPGEYALVAAVYALDAPQERLLVTGDGRTASEIILVEITVAR
ncbi:MAG: glycosyltransferase family 39 protein [Chloroflexota bacterium]